MGLSYSIINQGTQKNPSDNILYDSEILSTKTKQKYYAKCAIPIMFLNSSGNVNDNIKLTIDIDFTASNGIFTSNSSNHYLKNGMNDYVKTIKSYGDILAYYDYDRIFPVFGFSFKLINNEQQFNLNNSLFNYLINCNINNPEIYTIDNVLMEYQKVYS